MAALPDSRTDPVVELRRVAVEHLAPILEEETAAWRSELDWDFRPSADLVRRFVHMQALNGFALAQGPRLVGYCYYVCEEGKGLIGDLYVMRDHRSVENENTLLQAVLDATWRTPGVRRIEAQLMMLSGPLDRPLPHQNWFRSYPRCFLEVPLDPIVNLPARESSGIVISPWTDKR